MTLRSVMCAILLICCISVPLQAQTILARDVLGGGGSDMSNGTHRVQFEAETLSAGIYVCRLASGNFVAEQKMVLLK